MNLYCELCSKLVLEFLNDSQQYKQLGCYYFQIENKEVINSENDIIEVSEKEYYVCEACHSPKLMEALRKLSLSNRS